jgi:KaiC/GvpD/RAD55 family RecA-like ATPase
MEQAEAIKKLYLDHVPGAMVEGNILKGSCPFCTSVADGKPGTLVAYLDPESFFFGYFRCLSRCHPGGFPIYFGRRMGIDLQRVPGYDPDREAFIRDVAYPVKNLGPELKKFQNLMGEEQYEYFHRMGISRPVVAEMGIGYNGRYLVYPYFQEDGNCYAARCVLQDKKDDFFWHGDEDFFSEAFQVFNVQDIERCENGALFVTDQEDNLLALKELGYPGIAVPAAAVLENLDPEMFAFVRHVFLVMGNAPEALLAERTFATRLGFKVRMLRWPSHVERGYDLCRLAKDKGKGFRGAVSGMIKDSRAFSPFASPEKEHGQFMRMLEAERGKGLPGMSTGFAKMDQALQGLRGINVMGGQPKAGKSCFFMQVSSEMARQKTPVIYYDFENGRQKIYTRMLCRMSRLSENEIRDEGLGAGSRDRLKKAEEAFSEMLQHLRVVTDRKLSPDIMRSQIDFLQHETRRDHTLVVIDSLHKLPFKNLSERRAGIDEWLRNMEAIRDEQNVAFLVISELSRGEGGHYSDTPDLGSFKESGDIEYSADNAMVLAPHWDPLSHRSTEERRSTLWLVASRESSPGRIAEYILDYPYWGFKEED